MIKLIKFKILKGVPNGSGNHEFHERIPFTG